MCIKAGPVAETLATLGARVRFLSRVGSLMSDEVGAPAETLATLGALKGFLSRVDRSSLTPRPQVMEPGWH